MAQSPFPTVCFVSSNVDGREHVPLAEERFQFSVEEHSQSFGVVRSDGRKSPSPLTYSLVLRRPGLPRPGRSLVDRLTLLASDND